MESHYSSCPVVRDEEMDLFEEVVVDGTRRFFPIRKRVLWLRESSTQVVLTYNGVTVDEKETFVDFYGFLKSLTGAITDDAARWARKFKVETGDKFAVELHTTIEDRPYRDSGEETKPGWKRHFHGLPRDDCRYRWLASDKVNEWGVAPRLEAVQVAKMYGIYSTRKHPIGVIPEDVAAWIAEQKKAAGIPVKEAA